LYQNQTIDPVITKSSPLYAGRIGWTYNHADYGKNRNQLFNQVFFNRNRFRFTNFIPVFRSLNYLRKNNIQILPEKTCKDNYF